MTEPAQFNEKKVPAIAWRGKKWPVPELAARQLEEIFEPLEELTEALQIQDDAQQDRQDASGEEGHAKLRRGQLVSDKLYHLSRAQFGKMRDVVYVGLTRAHPALTRDEFDDAATSPLEMLLAFYVVREQSNFFGRSPGGEQAGEESAA